MKITANQNTVLKKRPIQSYSLKPNEVVVIEKGKVHQVNSIEIAPDKHVLVDLAFDAGEWFIFEPHWNGLDFDNEEEENEVNVIIDAGDGFVVKDEINWSNFDDPVSKFFTVGEVTQNDIRRIPENDNIKSNILTLAKELDKVRQAWGSPILVTSFYRDPVTNRRVGGVSNSQHVYGRAADICPANGKIWEFQKWLDERWYGAYGYGAAKSFVHCDSRNNKGFMTGGSKGPRWNY